MKKMIDAFDYAGNICKAMKKGILLTTKGHGQVNTMTIGWGTIGIQWGKPMFVAYVRDSRYTRQLLAENGEFTVNIPVGEIDSKILGICGSKSGRDTDKIGELGLTLEEPVAISVPGIKELPLTLECKVIYQVDENLDTMSKDVLDRYYPTPDYHIAYYGEILSAYIITD